MTTAFHLDYESRSTIDLPTRGLHNYASDKSTEVILCAFAEGDNRVQLWQPHLGPMPNELHDALTDPWVEIHAWNCSFEKAITKFVLGIDKPICEWRDIMVLARYMSLPGSLEEAGRILELKDLAKLDTGSKLISLFCEPKIAGGEAGLFGVTKPAYYDWNTHPDEWAQFCEYNKQDVGAERALEKKMKRFPLPDQEQRLWDLDQKINERGLPVNLSLLSAANQVVRVTTEELIAKLKDLTGLDNPNSTNQMLEYARTQGYGFGSLGKAFVARAMAGECDLTPACREALEIRKQTSKSSVRKYTSIGDTVSSDGRLRYQFSFMGAARTGRWASHGINLQNLPRPVKSVEKNMPRALELLLARDVGALKKEFDNPLDVVTSTLRAAFTATEGHKLVVCDLGAVENRVIGYLARCESILNVFREGRDPYLDFAVELYGEPYEKLYAEWKAGDSTKRSNAKPSTLGCGFGLSGGKEDVDANGDKILTGLRGYADSMHITLTQEEADRAVSIFRKRYPEVVQFWYDMEAASVAAVETPGHWFGVGCPVDDADRERYLKKGRKTNLVPLLSFKALGKSVLEMKLPSGRSLHYLRPQLNTIEREGKYGTYKKKQLSAEGKDQKTKAWVRSEFPGHLLCENSVQATARDILGNGLTLADEAGFPVILHVHDEIGCEVEIDSPLNKEKLEECMTAPLSWAPDLPLGAEGYEAKEYRK